MENDKYGKSVRNDGNVGKSLVRILIGLQVPWEISVIVL